MIDMLGYILVSLFFIVIFIIIIIEVRNEKNYQAKRRKRRQQPEDKNSVEDSVKNEIKIDKNTQKVEKKLPLCTYPKFTHERLIAMGLSPEESIEFVQELIPQLEVQIPLIEKALEQLDFHQMERLSHSLKGSATSLGTGGISDLLVEYNTYLKTGTDSDIARVYLEFLRHYTQELKREYISHR